MALKDRILAALANQSLDDDELKAALGVNNRQQVNQECRLMASRGLLVRESQPGSKIVNRLVGTTSTIGPPPALIEPAASPAPRSKVTAISEDDVKRAVVAWLEGQGFEVAVAWGHSIGIDIEARRGPDRWVVEAKGQGTYDQMSRNYFFGVIGSLIQRMTDHVARYAIALPDAPPFPKLVERLPAPARQRMQLTILFVRRAGDAFAVREIAPPV